MLLGIFLYNGTMFYELKNGTLVETKDAQGNFDLTQVLGNKYLEDVDSEKCVIVDTYSNRCFLISKDLLHHRFYELTHVSNARHSITWLDRRSVRILRLIRTVRLFRFGHTRLRCWQVFRLSGKAGDSQ